MSLNYTKKRQFGCWEEFITILTRLIVISLKYWTEWMMRLFRKLYQSAEQLKYLFPVRCRNSWCKLFHIHSFVSAVYNIYHSLISCPWQKGASPELGHRFDQQRSIWKEFSMRWAPLSRKIIFSVIVPSLLEKQVLSFLPTTDSHVVPRLLTRIRRSKRLVLNGLKRTWFVSFDNFCKVHNSWNIKCWNFYSETEMRSKLSAKMLWNI